MAQEKIQQEAKENKLALSTIEKINGLKNLEEATGFVIGLYHTCNSREELEKRFGSALPQISDALRKKLSEFEGGENSLSNTISLMRENGYNSIQSLHILEQMGAIKDTALFLAENAKLLVDDYAASSGKKREQAGALLSGLLAKTVGRGMEDYAYLRGREYARGGPTPEEQARRKIWGDFFANESLPILCAEFCGQYPVLFGIFHYSPKMEFTGIGGNKVVVLDFLSEKMSGGGETSVYAARALGALFEARQDERARKEFVSLFNSLVSQENPNCDLLLECICAFKYYFRNTGNEERETGYENINKASLLIIQNGSDEAKLGFFARFLNTDYLYSDYETRSISRLILPSVLNDLEKTQSQPLILKYQLFFMAATDFDMRRNEAKQWNDAHPDAEYKRSYHENDTNMLGENEINRVWVYFDSLFKKAANAGMQERFEMLGSLISDSHFNEDRWSAGWKLYQIPAAYENRGLLLEMYQELLLHPENIPSANLNALYGKFNPTFLAAEDAAELGAFAENIIALLPSAKKLQDEGTETARHFHIEHVFQKFAEHLNSQTQMQDDETQKKMETYLRSLYYSELTKDRLCYPDAEYSDDVWHLELPKIRGALWVPLISDLLKENTFQAAGNGYAFLLKNLISSMETEGESIGEGLKSHLFGQLFSEPDQARKRFLESILLADPSTHSYFEKAFWSEKTPPETKLRVYDSFAERGLELKEPQGKSFKGLLLEEGTGIQLRSRILECILGLEGKEEARKAALGLLYEEGMPYQERISSISYSGPLTNKNGTLTLYSNPDGTYSIRPPSLISKIFDSESEFYLLNATYCVEKLESGGLSAGDFRALSTNADAGLAHILKDGEKYSAEFQELSARYVAAVKKEAGSSQEKFIALVDSYGTYSGLESPKLDILVYVLGRLNSGQIQIDGKMLESVGRATGQMNITEENRQTGQQVLALLDAVFSIQNLGRAYSQTPDPYLPQTADSACVDYLKAPSFAGSRTEQIPDRYDPYGRATVLTDYEQKRLLSELGYLSQSGNDVPLYTREIAKRLDNRFQYFVLTKGQEEVLFNFLQEQFSAQNADVRPIVDLLLRNPANLPQLEQMFTAGLGTMKPEFDIGRMEILHGDIFDDARTNSILQQVLSGTSISGAVRAAAASGLYFHGEKIDPKYAFDPDIDVRMAAARALETGLAQEDAATENTTEKSLDPDIQTPAYARKNTASAATRANTPKSRQLVEDSIYKEAWSNAASERKVFAGVVEFQLELNRAPQPNPEQKEGPRELSASNYSQTAKINFTNEEGYKDILPLEKIAQDNQKVMDIQLPGFLADMGVDPMTADSLVAGAFKGIEINHVVSASGLAGGVALGTRDVVDETGGQAHNRIYIDMDRVELDAKVSGFTTPYMYVNVRDHEFLHTLTPRPEENEMHKYQIALLFGTMPLDEPLTEFFATMFEIYRSDKTGTEEIVAHAQKIGISGSLIISMMNDHYSEIANSGNFVSWVESLGPEAIFGFYINGDLNGLKALTEEKLGTGSFERVFPPASGR